MIQIIRIMIIALLAAPAITPTLAEAREVEGIAAIVNDEVISLWDVDQRVDLTITTAGITRTPETVERIRAQVLRSLIDEKLQLQEARRVEIEVDEEEINESIARTAADSNMDADGVREFLKENEISEEALRAQVRADIAWRQFVRRSFGGRVSVGETEIDEQYQRARRAIDQPRYRVGEILLAADSFADEQRIAALSSEIINQLREGVDFAAVARQFSISPSAAQGGQLGWVGADQLNPTLARALRQMQVGQISSPIPTQQGLYILALFDRRAGSGRDIMQDRVDVLSVRYPASVENAAAKMAAFVKNFRTCRAAEELAEREGAQINRSGLVALAQVPPPFRPAIMNLQAGELTEPQAHDEGVDVRIICDRKDDQGINISRDDIADNIFSQRVSMMARRHLRDLRRDAVVEYR